MLKLTITILVMILPLITFGQLVKFPKIVSPLQPKHILKYSKKTTSEERKVQYIGSYIDTLYIGRNSFDLIEEYKIPPYDARYLYKHPFYADFKISIFIDTMQILALKEPIWRDQKLIDILYDAMPVILQNNSDSTAIVGFGRRIPIVLEALDVDNLWKPVEKPYIYKCGTGLSDILLKPKDIICVLVPKYKGTFKTQLRLKLGNNVSKTFLGEINKSQIY
jgi:hypothetical protein